MWFDGTILVLSLSYNPMIRVGGVWTDRFELVYIIGQIPCPDLLQGIADGLKIVLAPTIQELKTVWQLLNHLSDKLLNHHFCRRMPLTLMTTVMSTETICWRTWSIKSRHPQCVQRKSTEPVKGKGRKLAVKARSKSKTVGRTHTPSYACAAATKVEKLKARQVCALCLKAGRPSTIRHKGEMCPFALGPAPEDCALTCPELPRLRQKAHTTSYGTGRPVQQSKGKKTRIFSIVGNEPVFVMEWCPTNHIQFECTTNGKRTIANNI